MASPPSRKPANAARLTPSMAERRIRALAADSGRIVWSRHALERMTEREIFDVDALRILRGGMLEGMPEATGTDGEWKCKMTMRLRGVREAGVVLIILKSDRLFIKTVEWEDVR